MIGDGIGWYGMVLDGWGIVWNDMRWYEMVFDGMGWHEMVRDVV